MNPLKFALPAVIVATLAAVPMAGAFGGPDKISGPDSAAAGRSAAADNISAPGIVLAQAAAPKASDFGGRKPNKDDKGGGTKIDAATAKKLREAKRAELNYPAPCQPGGGSRGGQSDPLSPGRGESPYNRPAPDLSLKIPV
jgi:hypothetical protein